MRITGRVGRRLLAWRSIEIGAGGLGRSAVVFSPHPDDESLGCGGTIVRKKAAGASVKVAHMTDGSAATHNVVSRDELRAIRFNESINAGRALGLSERDMYFLGFDDGRLRENAAAAVGSVVEILLRDRPEEVFVPYGREPLPLAADHLATTEIVRAALARCEINVTVWEYPVWFWLHWPWVGLSRNDPSVLQAWAAHRNSLRSLFGVRAFMDLRHSVDIGGVLEQKRAALNQHRSQMERLFPDPRWVKLADISRGQFLEFFRHDREFFHQYEYKWISSGAGSHP
jgi:LmbE family N-acetylglucosaminyl deacetylase